jgi:hypothetical protein
MKRLLIVDDDECLLDSLHVVFDALDAVQSALTAEDVGGDCWIRVALMSCCSTACFPGSAGLIS